MKSGIHDNHLRGNAAHFLTSKIAAGSNLSFVSAYFTSFAYSKLSQHLDSIGAMRFLFGEPRFIESIESENLSPPAFSINDDGLTLSESLNQASHALACAKWIRDKVEIRSVKQAGLMHGKLYHIDDGKRAHAMVGSSNFTTKGLGLTDEPNIELNLVVDSDRDRNDLLSWFEEIWRDPHLTQDVRDEVLTLLERLHRRNSPEFVYLKTLYHIFEEFLADQTEEDLKLDLAKFDRTEIWNALYEFQRDGVKSVLSKIDRYGGCILADSVGLGKTYTALAVIKWFELRNQRVLVLCPKKLRDNWTEFLVQNNSKTNSLLQDRFAYTVLSHTDLTRTSGRVGDVDLASIQWGNFDLVVIDESHNFRTASRGKLLDDGQYKQTRYEKLKEDIVKAGLKTKVLMLSATPVNNDLSDLKSQLDLLLASEPEAFQELGLNDLSRMIATASRQFKKWSRQATRDRDALFNKLPPKLFSLLDGVTIARSRKHVERHYAESMERIGPFPKRAKPEPIFSEVDTENEFPTFAEINARIAGLQLALYNPLGFVHHDKVPKYDEGGNLDQANRERFLVGLMKTGLLKRLESSVHSFEASLARTCGKIDERLSDIDKFKQFNHDSATSNVPSSDDDMEGEEDLQEAFEIGGALKYNLADMDVDSWAEALRKDRHVLEQLRIYASAVTPRRDMKLDELKSKLRERFDNPTVNRDGQSIRKVIVFTAYSDTARYLYEQLAPLAMQQGVNTGLVTGSDARATFGAQRFQDVLVNFAPRAKKRAAMPGMPDHGEIDLLIATDCISEGQNLQDADLLVNFDIHWNPVRLIQRFGRIDRLGSLHDTIRMVNFWPTPDLNQYINLKGRVEARMALANLSATGEDNILDHTADGDQNWRNRQIQKLDDEVFDFEDDPQGVTLSEFSLEDFRADLLTHSRQNELALEDAPLGLYAVTPSATVEGEVSLPPGVVFCLRRRGATDPSARESVGGLDPFFLVYLCDDGTVHSGFAAPRATLDIMRQLCLGRDEPLMDICAAFERETDNGRDMGRYDSLVKAAVADIRSRYAGRALSALGSERGRKLADADAQPRGESDFELVTWLVIKSEGEGA